MSHLPVSELGINEPGLMVGYGLLVHVGDLVDWFGENHRRWWFGEVVDEAVDRIEIHFIGWPVKFRCWVARETKQLQPPRTKTARQSTVSMPPKEPHDTIGELIDQLTYDQRLTCINAHALPHSSSQRRFIQHLRKMPIALLSIPSIRRVEMVTATADQIGHIGIKDHTHHKMVDLMHDGLIIDHEPLFVRSSVKPIDDAPDSNLIQFVGKYAYQYSAASKEYQAKLAEEKIQYETEIDHCKKLLHDLPIALANSQQTLTQQKKSDHVELSELGALVLEQDRISTEIQAQQAKLSTLESHPPKMDPDKFSLFQFQSQLTLPFGWHQLGGTMYEIVRVQPKTQLVFGPTEIG